MITLSVAIGVGVVIAVLAFARSWFRRDKDPDLGVVSEHWVTEQRLGRDRNG